MLKMFFLSFSMLTLLFTCNPEDACDQNDALKLDSFVKGTSYCLDENLNFEITNLQDSRCPLMVECVWAGNVGINLKFSGTSNLDTTVTYERTVKDAFLLNGYQFAIDSITPYPINPSDIFPLTVHMHVTK